MKIDSISLFILFTVQIRKESTYHFSIDMIINKNFTLCLAIGVYTGNNKNGLSKKE